MTERLTISEFATQVELSKYTLRYYENEGLLSPHRDDNGRRYYGKADIKWLKFIMHLKDCGMTIPELKEYVYLRAEGDNTIPNRLRLLKDVQMDSLLKLEKLKNSMHVLNTKIDWYEGKVDHTIDQDEDFATYLQKIAEQEQNSKEQ